MDTNKKIFNKIKSFDLFIEDVPKEFWENEEYIYKLLDINYDVFNYFTDEKKNSKKFVIQLLEEYKCFRIYTHLNTSLKEDTEILNMCIEHNLDRVPDKYKLDDKLIRKILSSQPKSLHYFPEIVINNIEYVRIAIKKEGISFIHASEELRNNIDIIFEATALSDEPNIIALNHLGEKIKCNKEDLKSLVDKYLKDHTRNEYFLETLLIEIDESLKEEIVKYIDSKKLYKNKKWETKKIKWEDDIFYGTDESNGRTFFVKFRLESFYKNKKANLKVETEKEYRSPTLDDLFILLDDEIGNDQIDDSLCINPDSDSELVNTNIDYIEIRDYANKIVYQSK
ncbi:MAG: DUF4116 domain-containing protein [Bacteroidota bacterium]|jgi:hypothetical protein